MIVHAALTAERPSRPTDNNPTTALPTARQADSNIGPTGNNRADAVPMSLGDPCPTISLNLDNQHFRQGDTLTVRLYLPILNIPLNALQFTLDFDMNHLLLQSVVPGNLSGMGFENIGTAHTNDGSLTLSWDGEAEKNLAPSLIMQATFTAIADGQLSETLHLSNRAAPAQAHDNQGNKYEVELGFPNGKPAPSDGAQEIRLFPNHPNPFIEMTLLRFVLPAAGEVILRVFDAMGLKIREKKAEFSAGENHFVLDRTEIGEAGVYLYEVDSKFGKASRKLIMF